MQSPRRRQPARDARLSHAAWFISVRNNNFSGRVRTRDNRCRRGRGYLRFSKSMSYILPHLFALVDKGLRGGIRLIFRVVQNAFFEQMARRLGYRFEESVSDIDIVIMPMSILVSYILSRILSDIDSWIKTSEYIPKFRVDTTSFTR